jgi:hypothetical protein
MCWATNFAKSQGTILNGLEHNEHAFVGVINGLGMNCEEVDTYEHVGK